MSIQSLHSSTLLWVDAWCVLACRMTSPMTLDAGRSHHPRSTHNSLLFDFKTLIPHTMRRLVTMVYSGAPRPTTQYIVFPFFMAPQLLCFHFVNFVSHVSLVYCNLLHVFRSVRLLYSGLGSVEGSQIEVIELQSIFQFCKWFEIILLRTIAFSSIQTVTRFMCINISCVDCCQ